MIKTSADNKIKVTKETKKKGNEKKLPILLFFFSKFINF